TPDYVHVLAYGVRTLVRERECSRIAGAIRAASGFAVFAHPMHREAFRRVTRAALEELHGWEVWNGKADGRWDPSGEAVHYLAALRRTGGTLVPMGGADLHRLEANPDLVLEVACAARAATDILAALGRRAYRVRGGVFTFAATDPLRPPPMTARRLAAAAALDIRRGAQRVNTWLARRGLRAPAPLGAVARRLLR